MGMEAHASRERKKSPEKKERLEGKEERTTDYAVVEEKRAGKEWEREGTAEGTTHLTERKAKTCACQEERCRE